jgi:uncharacterized protein involved in outer membrane biogenesis
MTKYIKLILITLAVLAMVCLIAIIGIVTFVSPNRLKPLLSAQVMKSTNRQLIIDGDLSWTFFPYLGVKTGHVVLNNPSGFQESRFMEIQSATIDVHFLPLLRNKIQSNGIALHGLKLFLIKNAKGEVNWHFPPKATVKAHPQNFSRKTFPVAMMGLSISNVDVTDGQIIWMDEQNKQSVSMNEFYLKAKNISVLKPFEVEIGFKLINPQTSMSRQFKVNGNIAINAMKEMISLRLTSNLYQGTLKANATIKLGGNVSQIAVQSQLANIQMGSLLNDLGRAKKKLTVNGTAMMDIQVTTAGFDNNSLIKNLNGNMHFSISKGTVEGIDISYYIDVANALLERRSPTKINTNKTEFDQLIGSATIKEGIVRNDDLVLTSVLFTSKGKGIVNLANQEMNYQIDTMVDHAKNSAWIDISNITIPISIKGHWADPMIRFESEIFMQSIGSSVVQQSKDVLKEKIKKEGSAFLQNLLNH